MGITNLELKVGKYYISCKRNHLKELQILVGTGMPFCEWTLTFLLELNKEP
jgi:hypothetical protein